MIALIGLIYYAVAGQNKEFASVQAPAGDDAPVTTSDPWAYHVRRSGAGRCR